MRVVLSMSMTGLVVGLNLAREKVLARLRGLGRVLRASRVVRVKERVEVKVVEG
jgi:hypothetical protein